MKLALSALLAVGTLAAASAEARSVFDLPHVTSVHGQVVRIDVGTRDGVAVGDVFAVRRLESPPGPWRPTAAPVERRIGTVRIESVLNARESVARTSNALRRGELVELN